MDLESPISRRIDLEYELSIRPGDQSPIELVLQSIMEHYDDRDEVLLMNWHCPNVADRRLMSKMANPSLTSDAEIDHQDASIRKSDIMNQEPVDFKPSPSTEETEQIVQKSPAIEEETEPMLKTDDDGLAPEASDDRSLKRRRSKSDSKLINPLRMYVSKIFGPRHGRPPPRDGIRDIALCVLATFVCLLILGLVDEYVLKRHGLFLVIPAFAAMASVVFSRLGSQGPLGQPPNVILGHVAAAVIGVSCRTAFAGEYGWLAGPLAVSMTIAVMNLTGTVHPAAGATALLAVYGGEKVARVGYWFVLVPVGLGTAITILLALLINNACSWRRYPLYWFMR